MAAAARKNNPNAINTLPTEYIDETLQFHPEWVVDKISPRPILFITTDDDRLVPPEESVSLYDKAMNFNARAVPEIVQAWDEITSTGWGRQVLNSPEFKLNLQTEYGITNHDVTQQLVV